MVYPLEIVEHDPKEDIKKEEPERDSWGGKLDFFLSALSYSGLRLGRLCISIL